MLKQTLALVGLTLSLNANAVILDYGTFTRDTTTGLDWLDVTTTQALSVDEVSAQFGAGGAYEGYRYATTLELDQLITHFGYVPLDKSCPYGLTNCDEGLLGSPPVEEVGDDPIVEMIIRMLGDTYDAWADKTGHADDVTPNGAGFTHGILGDTINPYASRPYAVARITDLEIQHRNYMYDPGYFDAPDEVAPGPITPPYALWVDSTEAFDRWGSFLVKQSPMPLPATSWLILGAFAGVIASERQKRLRFMSAK